MGGIGDKCFVIGKGWISGSGNGGWSQRWNGEERGRPQRLSGATQFVNQWQLTFKLLATRQSGPHQISKSGAILNFKTFYIISRTGSSPRRTQLITNIPVDLQMDGSSTSSTTSGEHKEVCYVLTLDDNHTIGWSYTQNMNMFIQWLNVVTVYKAKSLVSWHVCAEALWAF